MRSKISIFLMVSLVVSLCALTTLAQSEKVKKAQLWYVEEHVVKPPMVGQYEKAIKEGIARYTEHNFPYPFYTWDDGNFHYFYGYPVKNYAGIEKIYEAGEDVRKKWGEEQYQEVAKVVWESIDHVNEFVMSYPPGLSYVPESPRLKEEEQDYAIWDMFYALPGKAKELEELTKKLCDLLKSKNYNDELYGSTVEMGTDMPVYIGVLYGKNVVDLEVQNQKMWELLGEEGGVLFQKMKSLIRKRDFKQFWYCPDLSYTPKEK